MMWMMMLLKCQDAEQEPQHASIEASWDRQSALLVLREDVVDVYRLSIGFSCIAPIVDMEFCIAFNSCERSSVK